MLTEDAKKKELQDKYVVMKKTFDLLPDAENNIKQLQQISAASAQRLLELVRTTRIRTTRTRTRAWRTTNFGVHQPTGQ